MRNKISLRKQIDAEMRDVHLSAERIRRIHSMTDQKTARAGRRRRGLPRALPAVALSLALTACMVLAALNRSRLLAIFTARDDATLAAQDAPDTAETTFEAGGVTFTLNRAFREEDDLVLDWTASSDRADQVLYAFRGLVVEDETGRPSPSLPDAFNGGDSLAALGGSVGDSALAAARESVTALTVPEERGALVRLTMVVYEPVNEPRADLAVDWDGIGMPWTTTLPPTAAPTPAPTAWSGALAGEADEGGWNMSAVGTTPEPTYPMPTEEASVSAGWDDEEKTEAENASAPNGLVRDLFGRMYLAIAAGEPEEARRLYAAAQDAWCEDAIEDGQLVLRADGAISDRYMDVLTTRIARDEDFWATRRYDDATLELMERCGLIRPVGQVEIELRVPALWRDGPAALPTATAAPTEAWEGGLIRYAAETGRYFHSDPACSGMKDAVKVSEAVARARGQLSCPVCVVPADAAR